MPSQQSMKVISEAFTKTVSSTAIALTNAAIGFTAAQLAQADVCWIQVLSGQLRLSTTGTAPTTSAGWLLTVADGRVPIAGQTLVSALQLIRDGTTDVVVNVGLFRW